MIESKIPIIDLNSVFADNSFVVRALHVCKRRIWIGCQRWLHANVIISNMLKCKANPHYAEIPEHVGNPCRNITSIGNRKHFGIFKVEVFEGGPFHIVLSDGIFGRPHFAYVTWLQHTQIHLWNELNISSFIHANTHALCHLSVFLANLNFFIQFSLNSLRTAKRLPLSLCSTLVAIQQLKLQRLKKDIPNESGLFKLFFEIWA